MKNLIAVSLLAILALTGCHRAATSAGMSEVPAPYTRKFNFENWSATNPNTQQPGVSLDAEYNDIKRLTDELLARLALIQRDDGALKNGVVTRLALGADFASGVNPPIPYAHFTQYDINDSVTYNGTWYWCKTPHNSGPGFNPTYWQFIGTFFSGDPLELSLGTESLIDGILTAEDEGRAKMEDGYVTLAKLDPGLVASLTGGASKAWAHFSPQIFGQNFNYTFAGNVITAVATGSLATYANLGVVGGTISYTGGTGNNAILNGSWKILTFDNVNTLTFQVGGTPAGALTGSTGSVTQIFGQFNIKTITKVSDGVFAVIFTTALADAGYAITGAATTYPNNDANLANSIVSFPYDNLPQTTGFRLLCASYQQNVGVKGDFTKNNPDRITFAIFGN